MQQRLALNTPPSTRHTDTPANTRTLWKVKVPLFSTCSVAFCSRLGPCFGNPVKVRTEQSDGTQQTNKQTSRTTHTDEAGVGARDDGELRVGGQIAAVRPKVARPHQTALFADREVRDVPVRA